jgi:hydrogenase maturation protein HypF
MSPELVLHEFELTQAVSPTLGCGGESKSSICLAAGRRAWLTPPLGDLNELETLIRYQDTVSRLKKCLGIEPQLIAHDLHPDYASTRYARQQPGTTPVGVQHHQAHITSCIAEYGIDQPVIGICWDGTGWGSDGHIWGGEFLLVDHRGFKRRGHMAYLPLPGGTAAVREPYRTAFSLLYYTFGEGISSLKLELLNHIGSQRMDILLKMMDAGLNCPLSSSMGRLFDAVASILRLGDINHYEGEAAMALEEAAHESNDTQTYPYGLIPEDGTYIIDPRPLVEAVVVEAGKGQGPAVISRRFHNTLTNMALEVCRLLAEESGLRQVVLSGGVFQNQLLRNQLPPMLKSYGFEVLLPRRTSPNDSGIALGQVVAANAVSDK